MEQSAGVDQRVRRSLDVQDPRTGGHPLRRTVLDHATTADGVLVQEGAVDHVGHGLEAAVRVPRRPLGFARPVVDLAHLVHVHERVEVGHVDAREGAANREALALETARRRGDRRHATRCVSGPGLDGLGEFEWIFYGDGGHWSILKTNLVTLSRRVHLRGADASRQPREDRPRGR